jgi:hypothetical protein
MRRAVAALWLLLAGIQWEAATAHAAPATVTNLGTWQSTSTGGGTKLPPTLNATSNPGTAQLDWNAGAVHGKIKTKSPASVSFTGTLPFDVTGDGQLLVQVNEDMDVVLKKATLTMSVDLFSGTTRVGGILPETLVQKKKGNLFLTESVGIPVSAGHYQFLAKFTITRTKGGVWNHHSAKSRDFVVTVTAP